MNKIAKHLLGFCVRGAKARARRCSIAPALTPKPSISGDFGRQVLCSAAVLPGLLPLLPVLRCNALFAGLATNDLETLVEDAEQASCDPGVILFNQGDLADRFFLLLDGRVGLYLGQLEEMACLARIVRPGETVAEACICGQGVLPATTKVLPQSAVVATPSINLCSLIEQRPHFLLKMLSEMSIRLGILARQIIDMKMRTMAQWLAAYLLTLIDQEVGPADTRLPCEKTPCPRT